MNFERLEEEFKTGSRRVDYIDPAAGTPRKESYPWITKMKRRPHIAARLTGTNCTGWLIR